MPKYTLKKESFPTPLEVTLTMEQYFGCELPTLKIQGITVLHLLDDGRIVLRDNLRVEDYKYLQEMGMQMGNTPLDLGVHFIQASTIKRT